MSVADDAGQPGAGWDEAQCTSALAQLERLQAQIDDLRLAIPRIVEPFHQPFTSTTFKLYAQGALSSQNGIKDLSEQWKSLENQNTFEHVRKSYASSSDLSASALTPPHGWRERERNKTDSIPNGHDESVEDTGANLNNEDVSRIVVEFQKQHPDIQVNIQDDNQNIFIQLISNSTKLQFAILVERDTDGRHKLTSDCLGQKEPFRAITRCIASRPKANDLEHLLDMIAAYKTVKPTICAKCARPLDHTMLLPTARR
ncbi:hypothetical protein T440DRAFT_355142, partial [Plenodomus tracheiphilus IPT5]